MGVTYYFNKKNLGREAVEGNQEHIHKLRQEKERTNVLAGLIIVHVMFFIYFLSYIVVSIVDN